MRLKALIATGIVCTASFAAAGPVHAKDNGHGTVQRCQAAKNGKHNGFTCETTGGGTVEVQCRSGYNAMASHVAPEADVNGNGIICRRGNLAADDLAV